MERSTSQAGHDVGLLHTSPTGRRYVTTASTADGPVRPVASRRRAAAHRSNVARSFGIALTEETFVDEVRPGVTVSAAFVDEDGHDVQGPAPARVRASLRRGGYAHRRTQTTVIVTGSEVRPSLEVLRHAVLQRERVHDEQQRPRWLRPHTDLAGGDS